MLAQAHQTDFDTGPRSLGAGSGTAVRREPAGEAGRRDDPLRGRAAGRGGSGSQAQVAGTRHLGHRDPRAIWRKRFAAAPLRGGSAVRSRFRTVSLKPPSGCFERSALDALAIAGKGGQAVTGFSKVETALVRGQAVAVLHAADAAADGVRKVEALRKQSESEGRQIARHNAYSPPPNWIWHWVGQM